MNLLSIYRGFKAEKARKELLAKSGVQIAESAQVNFAAIGMIEGCQLQIGEMSSIIGDIKLERQGASLIIGQRSYFSSQSRLLCANKVEIGDDVLIGFEVLIMDHDGHSINFELRKNDLLEAYQGRRDWTHVKSAAIKIKDKAWIGARSSLFKGVTIGEGSVVAGGSVVVKDVPDWTLVAGNPAVEIKSLKIGSLV